MLFVRMRMPEMMRNAGMTLLVGNLMGCIYSNTITEMDIVMPTIQILYRAFMPESYSSLSKETSA